MHEHYHELLPSLPLFLFMFICLFGLFNKGVIQKVSLLWMERVSLKSERKWTGKWRLSLSLSQVYLNVHSVKRNLSYF